MSFGKKDQFRQHYKHSLTGTAKVIRLIAVFVQEDLQLVHFLILHMNFKTMNIMSFFEPIDPTLTCLELNLSQYYILRKHLTRPNA